MCLSKLRRYDAGATVMKDTLDIHGGGYTSCESS
jgi:hypothetical protein